MEEAFRARPVDGLEAEHQGSKPRVATAGMQARVARKTTQGADRRDYPLVLPEDGRRYRVEQVDCATHVGPGSVEALPSGPLHG